MPVWDYQVEDLQPLQPTEGVAHPNRLVPFTPTSLGLEGHVDEHLAPIAADVSAYSNKQELNVDASRRDSPDGIHGHGLLRCSHSGCTYEGVFSRQWELQRHIMTKHTREKPFWCPVVGCIKGRGAPAFARPDKLTQHIRQVHCRNGARAVCPADTSR